jgi:hypothetical protein
MHFFALFENIPISLPREQSPILFSSLLKPVVKGAAIVLKHLVFPLTYFEHMIDAHRISCAANRTKFTWCVLQGIPISAQQRMRGILVEVRPSSHDTHNRSRLKVCVAQVGEQRGTNGKLHLSPFANVTS